MSFYITLSAIPFLVPAEPLVSIVEESAELTMPLATLEVSDVHLFQPSQETNSWTIGIAILVNEALVQAVSIIKMS